MVRRLESMAVEPGPDPAQPATKAAAAECIAIQASRLARIASAHELGLLAYLIDMAVLEAWREANDPKNGRRSPAPE